MDYDIHQFEPLWGEWVIGEKLGEGNYGRVWQISSGDKTAAVKEIVVSLSEDILIDARSEGLNERCAKIYFEEVMNNTLEEVVVMKDLSECENIVHFEEYQIKKINLYEDKGWVILIKMKRLESLKKKIIYQRMHIMDVLKLGIDICNALEMCERKGIIHRDIKPDNLFYDSEKNIYKLGDFGIAHYLKRATAGKGRAGTLSHMSPEVYQGKEFTFTADLYALGMILYRLLNDNRVPLLPEYPMSYTPGERNRALIERLRGKTVPLPRLSNFFQLSEDELSWENEMGVGTIVEREYVQIAKKLGEIAGKAISADPKERYSSPQMLKNALSEIERCLFTI